MKPQGYMQKAITIAQASERRDGCPIGAFVVNKDGQFVGAGMSLAGILPDVTQHAETAAIQDACNKMKTINLEGCFLYGTLEPCGMCLSAAIWANVEAIYFGAYASDVPNNNYEYKNYSSEKLAKNSQRWNGSKIKITGGILRAECKGLLAGYKDWQRQSV